MNGTVTSYLAVVRDQNNQPAGGSLAILRLDGVRVSITSADRFGYVRFDLPGGAPECAVRIDVDDGLTVAAG